MATLTYDLAIVGRKIIESELASLERRFVQHARTVDRTIGGIGGGPARGAGVGGGRRPVGPMFGPGQREFVASVRAREKAELASAKAVTRERIAQERQVARERNKSAKEHETALKRASSEGSRVGRERAAREISVRNEARASNREFLRTTFGNASQRVMGTVGAIGRVGAAAVGLSGAALTSASLGQALQLDEMTRRLAINSRGPGQAGANPEELRKKFTNLGIETGIAPEQLAGGAMKYVSKTGDLTTAMANMKTFAVTAQATGASVEDIASAAADLSEKFDIKTTEDMGKALAVLTFQGKRGAFELKDMAEQFPEMAAAAQRAGMTGVKGMQTLGGLAQIARQSTGSGAEASTAVQMMLTQLTTKSGQLHSGEALGGQKVDVFEGGDPTKKARDIPTVISEVISKSHGNQQQLAKLFDVRGLRAVSPLIKAYHDAADSTTGTAAQKEAAGKANVLRKIQVASDSGGSWADVEADAADAMKATSVQLEQLKIRLENAAASAFFPALQNLTPHLEELVPVVAKAAALVADLVSAFAQNPLEGIGAAMTLAVMKEIASAGIGQAVSLAITEGIGLMAAGGLIALAVGAFEVGQMAVKTMMVEAQKSAEEAAKSGDEVRSKALDELKTKGYLSQETRNQLEGLNQTEEGVLTGADRAIKEGQSVTGMAGMGLRSLGSTLGLNDDTGTLGEAAKLEAASTNKDYVFGHNETRRLLDLDNTSKKLEDGAENVKKLLIEGATEAAEKLKTGGGDKPNRGDKPTGIKT